MNEGKENIKALSASSRRSQGRGGPDDSCSKARWMRIGNEINRNGCWLKGGIGLAEKSNSFQISEELGGGELHLPERARRSWDKEEQYGSGPAEPRGHTEPATSRERTEREKP